MTHYNPRVTLLLPTRSFLSGVSIYSVMFFHMSASSLFLEKGKATYEDRTVFQVSGKSPEAIQDAIKNLKKYSLDVYTEKVLNNDFYRKTIPQLSDRQVWCILT